MIIRIITCGVCHKLEKEEGQNKGWPGWGQLSGVVINGEENPQLCPACLARAADALTKEVTA